MKIEANPERTMDFNAGIWAYPGQDGGKETVSQMVYAAFMQRKGQGPHAKQRRQTLNRQDRIP